MFFTHLSTHKNGTRSVPGGIPTRSVGNDQSGAVERNWSAGRPPSRAGSLLQWNDARLQEIGRLAGRLRGQASLLQWNDARLQEIGRLSGRLRGQASLLQWNDARPQEIGRLSGRLRGQASLLQWNDARLQVIGRLSGRLRGQASLLQGVRCTRFAFHHSLGRALARLLLILIYSPLREAEWRRSSGGWARSAVRRSRTHREEVEAKPTGGDAPR